MAGAADAQVFIEAVLKDNVTGALNNLENQAKDTGDKVESTLSSKFGKGLQVLGGLAAGGLAALGGAVVDGIKGAMEGEEAMAQLAAVIESTGNAAGVSQDKLKAYADQVQLTTKFTAEQVEGAQAMLLTFTNIGAKGGIFDLATQTAMDMAQALGQDATQSALQLGKALNDPISGIGALQRVGVSFSDSQKEVIKSLVETGDRAGAQKLILQELQKEFGGSAEAAGKTMAGQLEIAKNAFGEVTEEIGVKLLPVITQLLKWVVANMPAIQDAVGKAMTAIGVAFNTAKGIVEGIIGAFNAVVTAVKSVAAGISNTVGAVTGAAESVWAAVKGVFVNGPKVFGDIGVGIVTAIADGVKKYVQNSVKAVQDLWASIKGVFANVGKVFADVGKAIIDGIVQGIKSAPKAVADALGNVVNGAVGGVKNLLGIKSPSKVFAGIGENIIEGLAVGLNLAAPEFFGVLQGFVNNVIQAVASINKGDLLQGVVGIVYGIANIFAEATDPVLQAVNTFLGAIGSAIQGFITAGPLGALLAVVGFAINALGRLFGSKPVQVKPVVPPTREEMDAAVNRAAGGLPGGSNGLPVVAGIFGGTNAAPSVPAPSVPVPAAVSLPSIGIQAAVATPILESANILKGVASEFSAQVGAFGGFVGGFGGFVTDLKALVADLKTSAANGTVALRYT